MFSYPNMNNYKLIKGSFTCRLCATAIAVAPRPVPGVLKRSASPFHRAFWVGYSFEQFHFCGKEILFKLACM